MSRVCRKTRDRLVAGTGLDEAAAHVASCPDCAAFARRAEALRHHLRDHHGNVEPDAAFAARVAERLPDGSAEMLGRAALRLLPATLALLLVLAWFVWQAPAAQPVTEIASAEQDLFSWVLGETEATP